MSEMNRREFVSAAIATAAACACLSGPLSEAIAAPAPSGAGASSGTVDIGALSDYSKDGISDKFIKTKKLAIIRADGKIFACTAVCTHKFRTLNVAGDHFSCPAHHSEFSNHGTVTKGPAQNSLVRYEI